MPDEDFEVGDIVRPSSDSSLWPEQHVLVFEVVSRILESGNPLYRIRAIRGQTGYLASTRFHPSHLRKDEFMTAVRRAKINGHQEEG